MQTQLKIVTPKFVKVRSSFAGTTSATTSIAVVVGLGMSIGVVAAVIRPTIRVDGMAILVDWRVVNDITR